MEAPQANERRRIRRARNRAQIPTFGNWDFDQDRVPITQYFDSFPKPPPHHTTTARASVYPYAACPHSYPITGYIDDEFLNSMFAPRDEFHGLYYSRHPHCPSPNMTSVGEVKGQCGTRRRRRRRSCLDNNRKVFDITEATPDSYYGSNDAVVATDLYDVGSVEKSNKDESEKDKKSNVKAKDEDLYKIPPELLRNSKRKKMRRFFAKCFVTICASY